MISWVKRYEDMLIKHEKSLIDEDNKLLNELKETMWETTQLPPVISTLILQFSYEPALEKLEPGEYMASIDYRQYQNHIARIEYDAKLQEDKSIEGCWPSLFEILKQEKYNSDMPNRQVVAIHPILRTDPHDNYRNLYFPVHYTKRGFPAMYIYRDDIGKKMIKLLTGY